MSPKQRAAARGKRPEASIDDPGQEAFAPLALFRMITGHWVSRAVYTAAKLGIADHLQDGSRSSRQLAEAIGAHPGSLFRLLRCLASLGVFTQEDEDLFGLSPLSEYLLSDLPGSLKNVAIMMGEEQYRAWGELPAAVRTGRPAFDRVFGKGVFDFYRDNLDAAEIFHKAMKSTSLLLFFPLLAAYDFSSASLVVDIGGGYGLLLGFLLEAHPHLRGVLVDLPEFAKETRRHFESIGIANRCRVVAGNFFESLPEGGDVYLLSHVLHDWQDDDGMKLLKSCREAMHDEGKLLILEKVIPPDDRPHLAKLDDLNMLVLTGGRERTEDEYRRLLDAAGFALSRVIPTASPASLLEAVPV